MIDYFKYALIVGSRCYVLAEDTIIEYDLIGDSIPKIWSIKLNKWQAFTISGQKIPTEDSMNNDMQLIYTKLVNIEFEDLLNE